MDLGGLLAPVPMPMGAARNTQLEAIKNIWGAPVRCEEYCVSLNIARKLAPKARRIRK